MNNRIYESFEEFYELIWDDYISEYVVSNEYIYKEDEFLREVIFDAFRIHQKSNGELSISIVSRLLESFLINNFRYQPSQVDEGQD